MYQLVILHHAPDDKSLFCQRFMDEQIYITIPEDHALAERTSVTFEDLRGIRILINSHIGFWMDICKKNLNESDLLIQGNFDALVELVEASNLPLFNSNQFIARGATMPGRISIPISDPDAHATYWLTCLASEQKNYRYLFNAVRGYFLRSR